MRLMKALIFVIAILILLTAASQVRSQSKEDFKSVIDASLTNAKAHALNSSEIKWDSIGIAMHEASQGANTIAVLQKSFAILFKSLDDHNATLFDQTTKTALFNSSNINSATLPNQVKFEFSILDNNICYLRLVAIDLGPNTPQKIKEIRTVVDSLASGTSLQWIVDLRYAQGGDTFSLLSSVGPLLDEGLVATTVDNTKKIKSMYTVHNGNFYVDQVAMSKFPLWTKDMRKAKIAVLTSRYTSGAAEILAIGLKGRKNTRIFGEATAGQIFGLVDLEISKNLALRLSNTQYVDRKGNEYNNNVQPNSVIEFQNTSNHSNDRAIAEASSWLTNISEPVLVLGMK